MNNKPLKLTCLILISTLHLPLAALALGTAFTYQGRLNDGAGPANPRDTYAFMVTHMLPGGLMGLVTAAMLAAAKSALGQPGETAVWRRYVLDVGLIAARHMSSEEAVSRLWEGHGRQLYAGGNMTPELVLLLSYGAQLD